MARYIQIQISKKLIYQMQITMDIVMFFTTITKMKILTATNKEIWAIMKVLPQMVILKLEILFLITIEEWKTMKHATSQ